ncbi:Signal transduction histidine-protein kinase BarA [compost metagenome]
MCDDVEMRLVLQRQLEQFQFIVSAVESARNALDQIHSTGRYDLVIVDLKLQDEEAISFAEKIKAQYATPVQVIVLISAYHESDLQMKAQLPPSVKKMLYYPISQSHLYNHIMDMFQEQLKIKKIGTHDENEVKKLNLLRHAEILLVEDNEINQQVAQAILQEMGVRVDVAGNGFEALARLEVKSYDAILMDLQMPMMDGIETTLRIRSHDTATPIIAMTADAMQGVKEQVLEVGMNAYISKPFEPIQLYSVLQRTMQNSKEKSYDQVAATIEHIMETQELDLEVDAALDRLGRNSGLYERILKKFKENHGNAVEEIREAISKGDNSEAMLLAHTLKGVASNIGATPLSVIADELQAALHNGSMQDLEALLGTAERRLALVNQAIAEFLKAKVQGE